MLFAVDARAAAAGLGPGLPLAEARAQLPGLRMATADPAADARALRRLADWCGRYSPWTAPDGAHDGGGAAGVLIDATGCAHLFGGEDAMLADLVCRLRRLGLGARAAMAGAPGAAWALARFATTDTCPTLTVPAGDERAVLAPLPPVALRLGAAEGELLHRLGLRTVGDLAALPTATLAPRAGREVVRRLDQALGRAREPIDPLTPVPPLYVRRGFGEPIGARADLAAVVEELIVALCRRLEDTQEGARRLELTLYRVDGTLQPVRLGTSRASRDADHLKRLFAGHLDGLDAGFGVEVMTLAATAVEPLDALQLALGRVADSPAPAKGGGDLASLIDRLENRLGAGTVTRPRPRGSRLPERAVRSAPPFARDAAAWPDVPPRPVRLLARPQPVEATALLPDHPPARFRWRRLRHRTAAAEGPERLSPEWWREAAEVRDYFRVETAEGRRYWLMRTAGRWYLHGVFG